MDIFRKARFASVGLLGASIVFSASTFAQNGGEAGSGPNPFSDCGIGAAIFKNHDVAAVISNVIWDIGTTAVTSALSSPETCEGSDAVAAQFIFDTYERVEEQLAVGSGEHLATVFNILQCDAADQSALTVKVRTDFNALVSADGYTTMTNLQQSEQLFNIVQTHTQGVCGVS